MFDLASLREITSRVTVKSFLQSSSVWSRGLLESSSVRFQKIIRLKIGWTVFISVVSHGFKIKIWKSSSVRPALSLKKVFWCSWSASHDKMHLKLETGIAPDLLKHAIVHPEQKKNRT